MDALEAMETIYAAAEPVLRIDGLHEPPVRWMRNVPEGDDRRGPWRAGRYTVLNAEAWKRLGSCLYVVRASDDGFRYVGVSNRGLKQRWRESPALDPATGLPLKSRQIFHRPCWPRLQAELESGQRTTYEVRVSWAEELLGPKLCPLISALPGMAELTLAAVVPQVERWFRERRTVAGDANGFLPWNAV